MVDQAANLRRLVLETDAKKQKKTKTIAITSGKGGVGKTSVAVSLSIALAQGGGSVTLLDGPRLANINVIPGIIPIQLYHVIRVRKSSGHRMRSLKDQDHSRRIGPTSWRISTPNSGTSSGAVAELRRRLHDH